MARFREYLSQTVYINRSMSVRDLKAAVEATIAEAKYADAKNPFTWKLSGDFIVVYARHADGRTRVWAFDFTDRVNAKAVEYIQTKLTQDPEDLRRWQATKSNPGRGMVYCVWFRQLPHPQPRFSTVRTMTHLKKIMAATDSIEVLEVRQVPKSVYDDDGGAAWDIPTIRAMSEPVKF
jgi:hypothetical protein